MDFSLSFNSEGGSVTWIVVSVGHNLVLITQQTDTAGTLPQPDETAISAALTAMMDALRHVPKTPRPGAAPTQDSPAKARPLFEVGRWAGGFS